MELVFMTKNRFFYFKRSILVNGRAIYGYVRLNVIIGVQDRVKYISSPMTRFNYGTIGNFC